MVRAAAGFLSFFICFEERFAWINSQYQLLGETQKMTKNNTLESTSFRILTSILKRFWQVHVQFGRVNSKQFNVVPASFDVETYSCKNQLKIYVFLLFKPIGTIKHYRSVKDTKSSSLIINRN